MWKSTLETTIDAQTVAVAFLTYVTLTDERCDNINPIKKKGLRKACRDQLLE